MKCGISSGYSLVSNGMHIGVDSILLPIGLLFYIFFGGGGGGGIIFQFLLVRPMNALAILRACTGSAYLSVYYQNLAISLFSLYWVRD